LANKAAGFGLGLELVPSSGNGCPPVRCPGYSGLAVLASPPGSSTCNVPADPTAFGLYAAKSVRQPATRS